MKKTLLCLLIFTAICVNAQAETIYFRNGKVIQGEIVRQTAIYIRLKSRYGMSEREFLLENIERIVKDGQVTYAREVMGGFEDLEAGSLDELPENVRQAAVKMAVSLIEEAMRGVDIPNMVDAPESVKLAAQQKVNEYLKDAVLSAQEPTPAIKFAATEIAAALIEESVKNVVMMPSLDQASNQVQEAAREKATALIDEALRSEEIDSLTYAPEVKLAARQKAGALIEAAMQEAEAPVIPQRAFDPTEIEIVMKQAVQKRVNESVSNEGFQDTGFEKILNIKDEAEVFIDGQEVIESEDSEEEFVPEIEVLGQKVAPPRQVDTAIPATDTQQVVDADAMVSAEVQKAKIEGLKKEVQLSPEKILLGLGIKDFLIIGLIIVLLVVLLTQRRHGSKGASMRHHDVAVSASLTYQNLPDDLKGRITSSDVTVILKLQAQFQDQVGLAKASKENKMVIVDDDQMIEYIFEHSQKSGHTYRREDIGKVMEAQEKALEEGGASSA